MVCFFIVFFKQKTAYELRISDWSSDVCSSDLGGGMLLLVAAYLLLCARSHGRTWTFRGTEFSLPSLRMAVGQVVASSLNWIAIAATIWILLPDSVGFGTVLAVFLLSSVAGAMTHVPGGDRMSTRLNSSQ